MPVTAAVVAFFKTNPHRAALQRCVNKIINFVSAWRSPRPARGRRRQNLAGGWGDAGDILDRDLDLRLYFIIHCYTTDFGEKTTGCLPATASDIALLGIKKSPLSGST